ncbi:MAG TPA: histidine phosphatase family protein [Intrasporangium sp.]|uniref:SixA phosphatase family protein n=1 Tax=Intrasporangium sp. TaxID=1925024 RepID=UPI002D789170|nr:histidine phosphatase family protein [Intrasporangium sp.]HET7397743.1 histidine phosphatase family protein [Intrasporangium sp.]
MSTAAREKTLVLMRHSKSVQGLAGPDHDRQLTDRGRRDAEAAGAWLREQGLVPDLVICSTAVRTRQTWEAACHGGAQAEFVEYRKNAYHGGAAAVLETIREDGGDMTTVLVVGHNPAMAELTSLLADGEGSSAAHEALSEGFSTTGLAVLRWSGEWADLEPGGCELLRFHVCRG